MEDKSPAVYFQLFTEISIISQLAQAQMEKHLTLNLSSAHFSVLNHLVRVKDGQTPLVVAQAFQMPKTTMTYILTVLEKHQLIKMQANPEDGRSKCIWITQKGRDYRDEAMKKMAVGMNDFGTYFPREDIGTLLDELSKIRQHMDARRDD